MSLEHEIEKATPADLMLALARRYKVRSDNQKKGIKITVTVPLQPVQAEPVTPEKTGVKEPFDFVGQTLARRGRSRKSRAHD